MKISTGERGRERIAVMSTRRIAHILRIAEKSTTRATPSVKP
jgi:hypothetical protein